MSDNAIERGPAEEQAVQEQGVDEAGNPLASPTTVQANRARMQGNGVGQKEINAQRDPTRVESTDKL
jgi:hypothetical protein